MQSKHPAIPRQRRLDWRSLVSVSLTGGSIGLVAIQLLAAANALP